MPITASTVASRGQRLAQRPDRQAPAIADTARIEHSQFDITRQRIVLQAIVAQYDIDLRMRRQQGFARLPPDSRPTHTGHPAAPGEEQRFVADLAPAANPAARHAP